MRTTTARARTTVLVAVLAMALVVGACGSSGGTAASGDQAAEGASSGGDWTTIEILDVNGETFTVESLRGRPVFVENFATWCSNCREQLGRTEQAAAALGDDAVFLALSVETEISAADVASYAADNDFTSMTFAVMSPDLLAAMADAFGTSAANPPSTPHVIVAADGSVGELQTGSASASSIEEAVRAAA